MPISFSALCIISLVMRIGVGEGLGVGEGVGVAVCASAFSGAFETASAAAPAAGSALTKLRRLIDVRFDFFIIGARASCPHLLLVLLKAEPSLTLGLLTLRPQVDNLRYLLKLPYFSFTTFAFPVR